VQLASLLAGGPAGTR